MFRKMSAALGLLALATILAARPAPTRAQEPPGAHRPAAWARVEAEPAVGARPGLGHGAAPGHAGQPNILEVQPPLAFWTLIVFLLLLLVLRRYAWGPLARALHDREHHLEETLQRAENARAESERLLAEHRNLMLQAQQQAQAVLDAARRDGRTVAEDIRKAAQGEAESTIERAHREIDSARDQALLEIWTKTADLAVAVAGKVLRKELRDEDHRRLIDQAMAELPAAPNGHRASGSAS